MSKAFSELGIKSKNLIGPKISIEEVLGKKIEIIDYRIGESKINRNPLLTLQILYEGEMRIIFTGSAALREDIEKIPKEEFPGINTTIIKVKIKDKPEWYQFT